MDELSWKVRLARSSINITNITEDTWYYEFPFHPKAGQVKWCKTFSKIGVGKTLGGTESAPYKLHLPMTDEQMANQICDDVLEMRKRLED